MTATKFRTRWLTCARRCAALPTASICLLALSTSGCRTTRTVQESSSETRTDTTLRTFRATSYGPVEADSAALTVALDSLLWLPTGAVYEAHTDGLAVSVGRRGRTLQVKARTTPRQPRLTVEESTEYRAAVRQAAQETAVQTPKPRSLWGIRNISYVCVALVVLFGVLWVVWKVGLRGDA
jgi:hypothetical protein